MDQESIKDTWKKYSVNLFFDERGHYLSLSIEAGPAILVNEIKAAIKALREGNFPRPSFWMKNP